jgi:glycosyltransferase involved in cell wall biosynthesis
VKTYVVGSNAPQSVLSLASDDIEVVGFVPEVEPWLARCRLSVSPLRYGAGVKGKINQAMAHGVPVVATAPSVEGMHLVEGEEVLVADDPRAFADAVALAYNDRETWGRLSRAGIENVRRHFSRDVAREAIASTFASVRRP